jgi:hypothetical protein
MTFTIGWPQAIFLVWMLVAIISGVINHGTPETGKKNVWNTLMVVAILIAIVAAGGFFSQDAR